MALTANNPWFETNALWPAAEELSPAVFSAIHAHYAERLIQAQNQAALWQAAYQDLGVSLLNLCWELRLRLVRQTV